MRLLIHTIAVFQLGGSLLLGSALPANPSPVESKIRVILDVQAWAYYKNGRFAEINCNSFDNHDCLFKTEKERFTLYALPKKGVVSNSQGKSSISSYAAVIYFDPTRQRLESYGCKTITTKRYLIPHPEKCKDKGLTNVDELRLAFILKHDGTHAMVELGKKAIDIRREKTFNQIMDLVQNLLIIGAVVVYIMAFIKYQWVRTLTLFLCIGLIVGILEGIILGLNRNRY